MLQNVMWLKKLHNATKIKKVFLAKCEPSIKGILHPKIKILS